jgi:hypothetical protein
MNHYFLKVVPNRAFLDDCDPVLYVTFLVDRWNKRYVFLSPGIVVTRQLRISQYVSFPAGSNAARKGF